MIPVKVVTVDDHFLIREGIKRLIDNEPTIELVGEGSCGNDVLNLIREHQPDIIILDINMPQDLEKKSKEKFRCISTLRAIQQQIPKVEVVILSQIISHTLIGSIMSLGVKAYLLKQDELAKNLIQAIHTVDKGGLFFSDTIAKKMIRSLDNDNKSTLLTRRQKEFIIEISQDPDSTYAEHAKRFNITEQSLKNQLHLVYRKLEVKNVTSAIIKSIKLGIVEIDVDELSLPD